MSSFRMVHMNINVLDMNKSIQFYTEAFGMRISREKKRENFDLTFMTDAEGYFELELTCLKDRTTPYDLSDNEIHLCFRCSDYAEALQKHRDMGIVAMENKDMGIYFVTDPDGYWIEVVPEKR